MNYYDIDYSSIDLKLYKKVDIINSSKYIQKSKRWSNIYIFFEKN